MKERTISRRDFNRGLSAATLACGLSPAANSLVKSHGSAHRSLIAFVERHRKPSGGYGWLSRTTAHITPTFAAVGIYRLLGATVPDQAAITAFVQSAYPVPDGLSQQPLWRLDYEQAQTLLWLGSGINANKSAMWKKPFVYNTYFEQNAYPTLQHQAMAVRLRKMT